MVTEIAPQVVPAAEPMSPEVGDREQTWKTITPEYVVSLWEKYNLQPERGHWQVRDDRTCAVGVILIDFLGERNEDRPTYSTEAEQNVWQLRFPRSFERGVSTAFDHYRPGADQVRRGEDRLYEAGYQLGCAVVDILIERGLL